jgi:outer membrane protein OmpA-like peptidoglycan-associated protein
VKVDEENYFSNTQEISTMNKTKSEEIPVIFELEKLIVTEKEVQTPEVVITEEEQQKVKDGTYAVPNIYWDYNKWNIRADAEPYLDDLVKKFKDNPKLKVELRSHCDSRGSDPFNDELSQKRADAVVEYLVAKGVKRSMFVSKGFGKRKLINRCKDGVECSEEEHQQNRRTEFVVLKK